MTRIAAAIAIAALLAGCAGQNPIAWLNRTERAVRAAAELDQEAAAKRAKADKKRTAATERCIRQRWSGPSDPNLPYIQALCAQIVDEEIAAAKD